MRIFVSTGEVSGDLQGGLLVSALVRQAEKLGIELQIEGLGGQKMHSAGANLIADTTAIGSVGLWESVPFILPTLRVQKKAIAYLQENLPDLIVLIDYVGPNLAIATSLKKKFPNVPIIWYIGPQFWVWTPLGKDLEQLLKVTDKLLAIFPEEAKFYQAKGLDTTYVGHPLTDRIKQAPSREFAREKLGIKDEEKLIVLLPASRKQELKYLLPVMCEATQQLQEELPTAKFYLPISLPQYREQIEETLKQYHLDVNLYSGETLEVLAGADLAITKSGTVNLELGLLQIPQIVIYKVNALTIWIARQVLRFSIPFMSPVNLVPMREIVPELLQEEASKENIVNLSLDLLFNPERQQQLATDYQELIATLEPNTDSICDRIAQEILQYKQKVES
jgi:lipid-A-disaccharide synthase